MENLRLERVPIAVFGLGLLGFDHLHIAWERNQTQRDQARWYVLEGLRDAAGSDGPYVGVEGIDGATTLSQSNGGKRDLDLVKAIGTPETRGSVIIPTSGPISAIWQDMAARGAAIDEAKLPYIAYGPPASVTPTINSSSVVATILYHAGIDVTRHMPIGVGPSPGTTTLLGTNEAEEMRMVAHFNALVGGGGNDTLVGGADSWVVERFLGGTGDDEFLWSEGVNFFHGGQPRLDYGLDGLDAVDYSDVKFVRIDAVPFAFPHVIPNYIAIHDGSVDHLFSIEGIYWAGESDLIVLGEGVDLMRSDLTLKLDSEDATGTGDSVSFEAASTGMTINASTSGLYFVQANNGIGSTSGIWLESAETITGSALDDRIYASDTMRGLDGGAGNDTLDARDVTPFTNSQDGYDLQIIGGDGDDTIVSGKGHSLATGGSGSDRFVLSALTETSSTVEFVIADAASDDRLFLPHEFFKNEPGVFDGSKLLPVLGGFTQFAGETSFSSLPENKGPWLGGPEGRSDFAFFEWQMQDDVWNGNDQTQGVFEFTGAILFNREGADLLIHVFAGAGLEVTETGHRELDWTHIVNTFFAQTETIIRVKDFSDGDLGIHFFDLGEGTSITLPEDGGRPISGIDYPNWDSAVAQMTNNGTLTDALEVRPDAPAYDPDKGESVRELPQIITLSLNDDTLLADLGPVTVDAGDGNDTVTTGTGDDQIDGGAGSDTMAGGAGNDTYTVDQAGDAITELSGGGIDTVRTSISYALALNLEHLELTGQALSGTGNSTNNVLFGNELDNELTGKDGDDALYGGAGRDSLYGGSGRDTFAYNRGDGDDVISDEGPEQDIDVLRLMDLTAADISLHVHSATPSSLILTVNDGGRIALDGFLDGGGRSIDRVVFSDGTAWSCADLDRLAQAAPRLNNEAPIAIDDSGFAIRSGTTVFSSSALTQNDSDADGDAVSVATISTSTPGISVTLDPSGNITVVTPDGYEGLASLDYVLTDGTAASTARVELGVLKNFAPVAMTAPAAPVAQAGEAYTFVLPVDLFGDAEGDALTLSATLANGSALPLWLVFDTASGTFSGLPPAGAAASLDIVLSASDGAGSGSTQFTLTVEAVTPPTVITGTSRGEVLNGTNGADIITGRGGPDELRGLGGNDVFAVFGKGSGFDMFFGGSGNDTISGGAGDDIIRVAGSPRGISSIEAIDGGSGYDVLRFGSATPGGTGSEPPLGNVIDLSGIQISGIELIASGAGDDHVTGSNGNDRIAGGRGADTLHGGEGDDTFVVSGGAGYDIYQGGSGYDQIVGSASNDVIGLAQGLGPSSGIEAIDTGDGFDTLRLTAGNDVLDLTNVIVTGLEIINAGAGNDRITGSQGDDVFRGGAGNDVFVFQGQFGNDLIADFQRGTAAVPVRDVIDLSGAGFESFADVIANSTNSTGGTLITAGTQGTLLLEGILVAQLKADDFVV